MLHGHGHTQANTGTSLHGKLTPEGNNKKSILKLEHHVQYDTLIWKYPWYLDETASYRFVHGE